jgi:hypothetical protein
VCCGHLQADSFKVAQLIANDPVTSPLPAVHKVT